MDVANVCSICDTILYNETATCDVHEKGLQTLIKKSKEREDGKWQMWENESIITVHDACRKRYTTCSSKSRKRKLESLSTLRDSKNAKVHVIEEEMQLSSSIFSLPSSSLNPPSATSTLCFYYDKSCFICGNDLDKKHKEVCTLRQKFSQDRLLDIAHRRNDECSKAVIYRLQDISIQVAQPKYHLKCYKCFCIEPSSKPREPIIDVEVETSFEKVCQYIENSGHFEFSLSDLQNAMQENVLSNKILFRKLKEKYSEDIFISQHRGRQPIIYYKTFKLSQICSDWFCNEDSVDDLEKKTILKVAAQILRNDIRKANFDTESYAPSIKFLDSVISDIPQLLMTFLSDLLLTEQIENKNDNFIKRDCIAHCIVSILRPKSFTSNLQLALGIYIYRKTGSRLIIDLLSKCGVCASYYSIQLYEASAIMDPPNIHIENAFVQYVFDNTDHNVQTLDGRETFHCLGGIAVYTPDHEVEYEGGSKKLKKMPSASTLASQKQINTIPYGTFNTSGLKNIEFIATDRSVQKLPLLRPSYAAYLWGKTIEIPKLPTWKGFFEVISNDINYSLSHINCLPFINEPPSQLTTINTALHYAVTESRKLKQKICFVTFDQPLYFKARTIVAQDKELKDVVVRLGGFHLLMSYLGAIGYIMDGSGIEDLWSTVYAAESIKKMLNGHAFSRALRAHILSYTALGIIICKSINTTDAYRKFIQKFFEKWSSEPPLIGDCNAEPFMQHLTEEFINKMQILEENNPTAKLWMQYFKFVNIAL